MTRAAIQPELLIWARERAGKEPADLEHRFPKLALWETGELRPTLKQLQAFATAVHVPIGYMFLPTPPVEQLPIPDFRTIDGRGVSRPSPDLLDMLYACQERQGWFKDYARAVRLPIVEQVGSATVGDSPVAVAAAMSEALSFDLDERAACRTWEEALRLFIHGADKLGILVMISGVVLSNNNRRLDPEEFRGFALADPQAPLVFINGTDSKSAQMFTLAHELAHLWLGATAVSNASAGPTHGHRREEVWCNAVAAELLVPLGSLQNDIRQNEPLEDAVARLTRRYKVSGLVILRRLLDVGWLTQGRFDVAWAMERARLRAIAEQGGGGGDFYRTTLSRVSRRFARALVESTLEGQTLYRDAFRMLGVAKTETFNHIGQEVGVLA
ncbi:MAG: ImmA/IrrE family metallo-endopeptidase [Alphaproteobacteria bacterium]|nr:MAG: ImmA/IrrE family metallo-endopeptidase [Alphaproteobacteria bacterium]